MTEQCTICLNKIENEKPISLNEDLKIYAHINCLKEKVIEETTNNLGDTLTGDTEVNHLLGVLQIFPNWKPPHVKTVRKYLHLFPRSEVNISKSQTTETLLTVYAVAAKCNVMFHMGKLFLSTNRISFYSTMFGVRMTWTLPWDRIVDIQNTYGESVLSNKTQKQCQSRISFLRPSIKTSLMSNGDDQDNTFIKSSDLFFTYKIYTPEEWFKSSSETSSVDSIETPSISRPISSMKEWLDRRTNDRFKPLPSCIRTISPFTSICVKRKECEEDLFNRNSNFSANSPNLSLYQNDLSRYNSNNSIKNRHSTNDSKNRHSASSEPNLKFLRLIFSENLRISQEVSTRRQFTRISDKNFIDLKLNSSEEYKLILNLFEFIMEGRSQNPEVSISGGSQNPEVIVRGSQTSEVVIGGAQMDNDSSHIHTDSSSIRSTIGDDVASRQNTKYQSETTTTSTIRPKSNDFVSAPSFLVGDRINGVDSQNTHSISPAPFSFVLSPKGDLNADSLHRTKRVVPDEDHLIYPHSREYSFNLGDDGKYESNAEYINHQGLVEQKDDTSQGNRTKRDIKNVDINSKTESSPQEVVVDITEITDDEMMIEEILEDSSSSYSSDESPGDKDGLTREYFLNRTDEIHSTLPTGVGHEHAHLGGSNDVYYCDQVQHSKRNKNTSCRFMYSREMEGVDLRDIFLNLLETDWGYDEKSIYHELDKRNGASEIVYSNWLALDLESTKGFYRELDCRIQLPNANPMLPSSSTCSVYFHLFWDSNSSFILETVTNTHDIPYGDYFSVVERFIFEEGIIINPLSNKNTNGKYTIDPKYTEYNIDGKTSIDSNSNNFSKSVKNTNVISKQSISSQSSDSLTKMTKFTKFTRIVFHRKTLMKSVIEKGTFKECQKTGEFFATVIYDVMRRQRESSIEIIRNHSSPTIISPTGKSRNSEKFKNSEKYRNSERIAGRSKTANSGDIISRKSREIIAQKSTEIISKKSSENSINEMYSIPSDIPFTFLIILVEVERRVTIFNSDWKTPFLPTDSIKRCRWVDLSYNKHSLFQDYRKNEISKIKTPNQIISNLCSRLCESKCSNFSSVEQPPFIVNSLRSSFKAIIDLFRKQENNNEKILFKKQENNDEKILFKKQENNDKVLETSDSSNVNFSPFSILLDDVGHSTDEHGWSYASDFIKTRSSRWSKSSRGCSVRRRFWIGKCSCMDM